MAKQFRNFFVSYHHEYDQEYLEELRVIKQGMNVADYSLKKDISEYTDEQIYKVIRNKMRSCSVTIVLIGERTGYRKWIDWELWANIVQVTFGGTSRNEPKKKLIAIKRQKSGKTLL